MIMKRKANALALSAVGLAFCEAPVPKCCFFNRSKSSTPAAAGRVHGSKARLSLWGIASVGGETSTCNRMPLGDGDGSVPVGVDGDVGAVGAGRRDSCGGGTARRAARSQRDLEGEHLVRKGVLGPHGVLPHGREGHRVAFEVFGSRSG